MGCQLVFITNRKSHTDFLLVPTSVTFNGVIAVILCFYTEFIVLQTDYVTVAEDRPIMSAKYCL